MNRLIEQTDDLGRLQRSASRVKSTTSANRIEAAANWSAIVPGSAFSRSAMEWGRMLSNRFSARSCSTRSAASASSRCLTNVRQGPTDRTRERHVERDHRAREPGRERRSTARGQLADEPRSEEHDDEGDDQRTPARAPSNTSAPSGARMPHRPKRPTRGSHPRTPSRSSVPTGCRAARPGGTMPCLGSARRSRSRRGK